MIGSLCALLALAAGLPARPADLPFEARVEALAAAHPETVSLASIGESRHGRPLHLIRIADGEAKGRPAVVIVAGANSVHRVGTEVAVGLAEQLAADRPEMLKSTTIYIVPCLNPDGLEWQLDKSHPVTDFGRTLVPYDADRDGRVSEDPAEDLNGDGVITMMRIKNPRPGSGLRAEYLVDPENPKLLKKPDAAKGERAEYALLIEGADDDGDGRFNEDGIGGSAGGGIDLDMNFPARWPEFADGAGRFATSEPEARALVRWMLDQSTIAAVLVYGPGDTLVNVPQAGKFDVTGQVPLGIEEGDKAAYESVSKLFKEATAMTGAPTAEMGGTFQAWAYAHYGVWSFQTPVWVRPDLVKKPEEPKKEGEAKEPEKKDEKKEPEAKPAEPAPQPAAAPQPGAGGRAGGGARGGRRGGPPGAAAGGGPPEAPGGRKVGEPTGDDGKWLKYDAERVAAGDPSGFREWATFDHPQLGQVEIGGFVPGFRHNPPASELPRLVGEQARFVQGLAAKLPRVTVEPPSVEQAGPGLWRIAVRASNDGELPTMPAIGVKARRGLPKLISLDVALDRIVSGERIVRAQTLAGSGGQIEAQWMITGEPGSTVKVSVRPTAAAPIVLEIPLKETSR